MFLFGTRPSGRDTKRCLTKDDFIYILKSSYPVISYVFMVINFNYYVTVGKPLW